MIDFEVTEHRPVAGPALTLVKVEYRPVPGEPVHSNIFHQQLYPTGRRLVKSLGRLVTESGKLILPIVGGPLDGLFPDENPADLYRREPYTRNNDAEIVVNIEAYWERKLRAAAEGHPYPQHHRSTLNLQVGASIDDASETQGNTSFNNNFSVVTKRASTISATDRWVGGERFTNVTIAQADTIDAATMQLQAFNTSFDDANFDIHAEDVDDSADYSATADVTDRTRTAASVAWVADALGTGWVTSPEIKTVIQEVIDRGSWASGNDLSTLSVGKSDTTKDFRNKSYDNDSALAAKLDIDFTGAAVGQPTQHRTQGIPTGSGSRDRPGRWN